MFSKKKKKCPVISAPQNFQHLVHTSFDLKEGKRVCHSMAEHPGLSDTGQACVASSCITRLIAAHKDGGTRQLSGHRGLRLVTAQKHSEVICYARMQSHLPATGTVPGAVRR